MQQEFVIQYVPIKNCLLHVSNKWYKSFSSSNRLVIQLQYKNNVFYFSCICNSCNIDDSNIGINAVYANSLGIDNNSTVVLSVIQKVAIIDKLSITPASLDDWEIIELNTELIQSTLLNSIRIVALNQNIVIWVGPSLYLTARVDEMNPNNHFGCLENFTEIEIKQPKYQNKLCNTKIVEESIYAPVEQFSDNKQLVKLEKYLYHNQNIILRVHPIHAVNIELIYLNHRTLLNNPFTCFVRSKHFPWKENDDIILCKILCSHVQELSRNYVEIKNPNEVFIQLCIIDRIFSNVSSEILESTFPCFLHGNIYLTEYLYKLLSLEDGNHIIINPNILKPTKITEIQLISCSECDDLKNQFILFINQFKTDGILLNSNTVINISDTESCVVKLIPENVEYYHLNTENIKDIKISTVLNETETKVTLTDIDKIKKTKKIIDLDKLYLSYGNLSQIIEDCINHLKICLYSNTNLCGGHNILIKGQQGSGKSTLSKIICEKLSHFPFYLNTRIVDCKSLKGKKVETVQKSIIQIFDECVLYQPSIVIFDDLDTICGSSVESGDGIQNSETAYFNRMSEMIMTLLLEYQNDNLLSIIATIESTSNFNKILYSSRGKHIFLTDLKTPVLENNDREILLKHILNQTADASNITFEKKEKNTDGYVIQDIVDLGVKCSFEAFKRTDVLYREEKPVLENIDYENALLKFKALSLQGVNLYKSVGRKWDQIGGLKEAKEVLIETVFWPLLHSDILSQCPIRLQSGILLYGPPGTGKTILAGAAAEEFNIRLISVKGPELLSKYIGASEEAVRNIFEKAQSTKPCILFFDEFDSLAPRRGHDNTGVTDRVVNQLLTQLDGVESLIGVYVIAATSRPDLLDPALIRPGRLGRQVYCPIPNQEDRLSILSLLSSDLEFCEDVDLSCIANVTEGFSGADLQSVLYSSQMLAIDEIMNVGDEETLEDFTKGQFPTKALISQKHILDALANTQPSLSDKEKLKYKKIYDKFHGKIDGDTKEFVSQRVTLA